MKLSRRVFVQAGAGALAALSLSACSGSGSGNGRNNTNGTQAAPTMTSVPASMVPGAVATDLRASTPRTVHAAVPQIATARNLTQAIEVVRERTLRQAAWDKASAVEISSEYIAASSDVLAVTITAVVTRAGKKATTLTTLWYDAPLSQTFSPSVLISWPGWAAFSRAVGQAASDAGVDRAKALKALQDTPAPYGTGPAIAFDTEGGLMVAFPPGALKAEGVTLGVPAKTVTPLLSDYGVKAEGASHHPSTFDGQPSQTGTWWTPPKNRPAASASPNLKPLPGDSTARTAGATASATPSASGSASASPSPSGPEHPSTAVGIDCIVHKAIALTYDDGPGPHTGTLLATLEKYRAGVTLFQMGNSIDQRPKTTLLAAASGFEIGSHTISHPDLSTLGEATLRTEITGNADKIKKIIGRAPLLLRPPYGDHNAAADAVATANNEAIVNWSVDTQDWKTKSGPATEAKVLKDAPIYTEPIVLMHDIHDFTINAAPAIVSKLIEQGYKLVTVSELTLNTGGLKTGHAYCRGTSLVQDGYLCKG